VLPGGTSNDVTQCFSPSGRCDQVPFSQHRSDTRPWRPEPAPVRAFAIQAVVRDVAGYDRNVTLRIGVRTLAGIRTLLSHGGAITDAAPWPQRCESAWTGDAGEVHIIDVPLLRADSMSNGLPVGADDPLPQSPLPGCPGRRRQAWRRYQVAPVPWLDSTMDASRTPMHSQ
jgi:hypothetical protein